MIMSHLHDLVICAFFLYRDYAVFKLQSKLHGPSQLIFHAGKKAQGTQEDEYMLQGNTPSE